MARSTFVWDGLQEYREEIRRLPEDCRGEAAKLIEGSVNSAYFQIAGVYRAHRLTGTLARRLTISPLKVQGLMTTGLVLRSGSPLAWLFDNGSQARHYVTENGVTHLTGRMPARPTFNRIVGETKRKVAGQLRDMLLRRGAVSVREAA